MDIIEEIKKLATNYIYVTAVYESLGSDEWCFGFKIDWLPKDKWELKRRATSFEQRSSFFDPGGSYSGGWDTIEEALEEGIKYANNKILTT